MIELLAILILAIIVLRVLDIMSAERSRNKYDIQEIKNNICKVIENKKDKA